MTEPEGYEATWMIDATFTALPRLTQPIADRSRVLVHLGTAHAQATLALLGTDTLEPGESAAVQLRLDTPIAILPGEPYIIRGFAVLEGYGKTLGGGRALMPQARRHRRTSDRAKEAVETVAQGEPAGVVTALCLAAGEAGLTRHDLVISSPLARQTIDETIEALVGRGELLEAGGVFLHRDGVDGLSRGMVAALKRYHDQHPALPGVTMDELRTRVRAALAPECFARVAERVIGDGTLQRAGDVIFLAGFQAKRSAAQDTATRKTLALLEAEGTTPPKVKELPELLDLPMEALEEALMLMQLDGQVVRVNRELTYATSVLDDLQARLVTHLKAHGHIDTSQFKTITGASRKWTIPLGEYFDRIRLTVRVGDQRHLRT